MPRLIMVEHYYSGDMLVIDMDAGLCSEALHYQDMDAPLDWFQLDEDLGAYDPSEWEIIRCEYTHEWEIIRPAWVKGWIKVGGHRLTWHQMDS